MEDDDTLDDMSLNSTFQNFCRYNAFDSASTGPILHSFLAYILPVFGCVGLVGNILTLITLNAASNKQSKKTSLFLMSKAVSDFGVGIFAILLNLNVYELMTKYDGYNRFYHHELYIPVFVFMNWFLMSSTWFAVAVTFERMVAIIWPLQARHKLTTTRIAISIVLISILSLVLTIYPFFILTNVTAIDCKRPRRLVYTVAGPLSKEQPIIWYYGFISRTIQNLMASVIPVLLLIGFNTSIVWHMREHSRSLNRFTDAGYNLKDAGEQVRVSLVVFAITATTAVFLLPSAGVFFYDTINRYPKSQGYKTFVHASNLLVFCDKVLDFFLYCLVSANFRRRLVGAWRCTWGKLDDRRRSSSRSQETIVMCEREALRRGSRDTVRSKLSHPL